MNGASERYGSSKTPALVRLSAEGITCDLRVRSVHRREGSATYDLIVSNHSDVKVSCRLYSVDATARTREFGMLTVGKQSAGTSFFAIPLDAGEHNRIYVEVVGEGVNLFAEALPPTAREQTRRPLLTVAAAVFAVAIAAGLAYQSEKPTVQALSLPASAAPGTVTAKYAIGGRAAARYVAQTSDGTVIARGALSLPKGNIAFRVPAKTAGHTVRLSLVAAGPLGHVERTAALNVISSASGSAGSKHAMSGHPVSPKSVHVPGGAGGSAVLAALVAQPALAVSSRVVKGAAAAPASPAPASAAPASAAPASAAPASAAPRATALLQPEAFVVPARVVAGQRFSVSIPHPVPGLRISFKDNLEAVVAQVAVAPNAGAVTFSAPASPNVETYYLAATFDQGNSKATTVKAVRVYPR